MKLDLRLVRVWCALAIVAALVGCASRETVKETTKRKPPAVTAKAKQSPSAPVPSKPAPSTAAGDGSEFMNQLFGKNQSAPATEVKPVMPVIPKPRPIPPGMRPTPQQLLATVQQLYRSAQSLKAEFVGSAVTKSDGKVVQNSTGVASTLTFKRPAMFSLSDGQTKTICDGKSVVNYAAKAKRYARTPMSKEILQAIVMGNPGVSTLGLLFGVDYTKNMSSMKLLPDSRVGKQETYVLALQIKTPKGITASQRLWIGKRDLVVRRTEIVTQMRPTRPAGYTGAVPKLISTTLSGTLVSITPNPKLADSTFKFTPPAGVTAIEPPKKVDLTGKPAPDFSFKWTDGSTRKLSDFRGKPVVLEFWAMPMAAKQLPALQAIFEKHKDAVEVISVNFNNDPEKLSGYLKSENLTFPVVNGDKEVAGVASQQYSMPSLPCVYIIDAQGIIRAALPGQSTEKAIEAELAKL